MSLAANARGMFGERRAREWYLRNGYELLDRNWRSRAGEIDLIVRDVNVIVFVEVKARADASFGIPAEAVTWSKAARLRRLANEWLSVHEVHAASIRFDVVAVTGTDVEVIEGAF
jgi:putative endonuclease